MICHPPQWMSCGRVHVLDLSSLICDPCVLVPRFSPFSFSFSFFSERSTPLCTHTLFTVHCSLFLLPNISNSVQRYFLKLDITFQSLVQGHCILQVLNHVVFKSSFLFLPFFSESNANSSDSGSCPTFYGRLCFFDYFFGKFSKLYLTLYS